jgi:asparagine synthase (glutamine-hydrolysing)
VNGFHGSLTARGTFHVAVGPGVVAVQEHAGCRVLVRGYLADRAALGARLGLAASRGGASDGELLAHAFRRWGTALQAHVAGEYAAVVFDTAARTALLTHDALGVMPLFYARRGDGLAFAADILDLLDDATCATVDDEYLADFLAAGAVTGERTPYPGVRRLLPGRSLSWSGGELRDVCTWDLADVPEVRCRDDAEYEERFRALLAAGVETARDRDGVTWVSLSGGLDSSSIACVAAQSGLQRLAAYSVLCTRWPAADEGTWMRAVVDRCGLAWHTLDIETMLPFSQLPGAFHGEPTHAAIGEAQQRVHDELFDAHGVTAVLNGHAGDAVLCASPGAVPAHLADPLFDADPLGALRGVAAWKHGARDERSYSYWFLRGLVAPAADHLLGTRSRNAGRTPVPPWFAPDYARTMRLGRRASRRLAPRCRRPGRQELWHALWTMSLGATTIPRRGARYDSRFPLLYRPLVEFMCGIPWEQKLRPRCDRYLQRRALAGVLPELVRRRASKGSGNPAFVEGLRRSRDWLGYLCDDSMLARRGIVDAARWRAAVLQAGVGQTHDDRFFLGAVAVETWLKQLADHRAAARARAPLAAS